MRDGRPSLTARKVALNTVMIGAMTGGAEQLPKGAAEASAQLLVASGAAGPATVRLASSPRTGAALKHLDGLMPGQLEGFARRKRFFEAEVRAAIDGGAAQVLVVGAGYDTLAWRLAPTFPHVRFLEIDHPATARLKARGVAHMGERDNLELLAEDLAQRRLQAVLEAHPGWDVSANTVACAEGLLMYLPEGAVKGLFVQLAACTGASSRVVCSCVGQDADGRPHAGPWGRLTRFSLWLIGEPWRWGVHPEELGALLAPLGWRRREAADPGRLRAGIEHLAVVERIP